MRQRVEVDIGGVGKGAVKAPAPSRPKKCGKNADAFVESRALVRWRGDEFLGRE